jgi:hypothetical protein
VGATPVAGVVIKNPLEMVQGGVVMCLGVA